MFTATRRSLVATAVAAMVLMVLAPVASAHHNPNHGGGGQPAPGSVGNSKDDPQGSDDNNGHRCADNSGAGQGNPAHDLCSDQPGQQNSDPGNENSGPGNENSAPGNENSTPGNAPVVTVPPIVVPDTGGEAPVDPTDPPGANVLPGNSQSDPSGEDDEGRVHSVTQKPGASADGRAQGRAAGAALPFTGPADLIPFAVLGFGLVGSGGALVLRGRRRS